MGGKAKAPPPDNGEDVALQALTAQESAPEPTDSGKQVAVVTADGRVVGMSEQDAAAVIGGGLGTQESLEAGVDRDTHLTREARFGDAGSKASAAMLGVADDLTLGGASYAMRSIDPDTVEAAQANPGWNKAGTLAGFAIPGFGEVAGGGLLAKAGAYGEAVGGAIGREALKGSVLGGGAYLAESGVSGDPLTIEGAARAMGLGAAISAAAEIGGDALVSAARKLGAAKKLSEVEDMLDSPPDSYKALANEVNSGADTLRAANSTALKQAEDYNAFISGGADATNQGFNRAIATTVKAADSTYNDLLDFARTQSSLTRAIAALGDEADQSDIFKYIKESNDARGSVRALQQKLRDIPAARAGLAGAAPAAESLRALQDELTEMPQASKFIGSMARVPTPPASMLAEVFDGKMPTSLRDYLALPGDKVAAIANTIKTLGEGSTAKQALDKFLGDVGLQSGGDAAIATAGAHRTLNDQIAALETAMKRLKAVPSAGIQKAGKALTSREEQQPGPTVLRRALSHTLGHAIPGGALGGAMVAVKHTLIESLKDLVERYGEPVGRAIKRLGPVTSWLASSFPSGKKDKGTDLRRLALNRAREYNYAAVVAPDAVYSNLSAFHGQPNNIPLKLHQQIVGTIQHLAGAAPKDSGLQPKGAGSTWLPSLNDAIAFAHRLEASHDPHAAITRLLSGQVHPAAVDTLQRTAPATMQYIAQELASRPLDGVTHDRARGLSQVIGAPMTGLQIPAVGSTLQAVYARAAQTMQPQPTNTPKAPGRPAAVGPSPLAGSNPANHIQ